ncbi:TIGR04282 family arsenosugar biosynthesis glycosyltransferase [Ruania halotolerans]|uniref:TIGR04282 family arsenosugar biosynthesis glycosyltransferase n=1 Tax=Ruania halotolerans TaxID=2897773 RepID=UPI001E5F995F|nr:TIGR04282 family arsenosugar biosynthesis glycosyltransferase [Ruania halotolerans]UFU06312.1 glycosyltransferase [Ruania halotolerans]
MTTLIVLAKAPVAGRVKTRLQPGLTPEQAAGIARASLDDTLRTGRTLGATRLVLCLDGDPDGLDAAGYDVVPQVAGGLDARIDAALGAVAGPVLLVGMDTPQLRAAHLPPLPEPWPVGVDAWFGPARDGGFWALGLARPVPGLVNGVPMSRADTGALMLARLREAGLGVLHLPELVDIDTVEDLAEVAVQIPGSATAELAEVVGLARPLGVVR